MIRNISTCMAAALALAAFALMPSGAMAQSYSGNWPMTETQVQRGSNTTYCLTLTDNGSNGFEHSGPATVTGKSLEGTVWGAFEVINNILVATFTIPGDEGETAGLVFTGPASKGQIGKGFAELVSGAENIAGALAFGVKNGC